MKLWGKIAGPSCESESDIFESLWSVPAVISVTIARDRSASIDSGLELATSFSYGKGGLPVTHLRQLTIEELKRRNLAEFTIRS